MNSDLRYRKNNEDVKEEAETGLKISSRDGTSRIEDSSTVGGKSERAFCHFKAKKDIPKMQSISHATERRYSNGKPSINKDANKRVANGKGVEEQWVYKQPCCAYK